MRKFILSSTALAITVSISFAMTGCNASKSQGDELVNRDSDAFLVLQDENDGEIKGKYYLKTTVDNYSWGLQPNASTEPGLIIESGSTVTIDTLSHEGMLEDQGKNPIDYFKKYGLTENDILKDAITISESDTIHNFDEDGPHILTSPIYINDAKAGDIIKVDILELTPRVPYGVISNRHYKGALIGEFPENEGRVDGANSDNYEKYNNVSKFAPIKKINGDYYCYLAQDDGSQLEFLINPFLGTMGLVSDTNDKLSSVPPTHQGGNIDINELGVGSTLYLPAEVDGGLFYVGDPHFAQGDGEVSLTALEGSLRATFRITVLKAGSAEVPGDSNNFDMAFGETENHWIPIGLNVDLDEAMKNAVRESVDFINEQFNIDRSMAYAYLSASTDYEVSQVVDKVKGINGLISKVHFKDYIESVISTSKNKYDVEIVNNTFYVEGEKLFKEIGANVDYNTDTNVLTIIYNNKKYKMTIDSNKYYSDGRYIYLDNSPLLMDNKFMIPTSSINKVLGIPLNWSTEGNLVVGQLELYGN